VDRLVVPSARACHHTQKAPHAAHAEPTLSPCLRPAPEGWHAHANPQRHKPRTVLSHDTGSAASGLPAIPSDGRTRRPVAD